MKRNFKFIITYKAKNKTIFGSYSFFDSNYLGNSILTSFLRLGTAKPVGSACIGEHHNATNVSPIIATL
jgi:hypothetical protein